MALATISVDAVEVGNRLRSIGEEQVSSLMSSIGDVGLLNPITVYQKADGLYGLVAGAHRFEACRRLGLADIDAQIVDMSDMERQIAECDENLCSSSLTPSEKALFTAKRKEAYEALHPEAKNGRNQHSVRDGQVVQPSFAADQAVKTGVDERTVRRDAERGEKVIAEVIDLINGTKLDTGAYLDKIKRLPPNEQMTAARRDLALIRNRERDAKAVQSRSSSKIDADVKSRAAKEVAEMIAEHVPGEWWDAIKSNLYASGAANIANELNNITGNSVMDRRFV